jgi:hypothetical protein
MASGGALAGSVERYPGGFSLCVSINVVRFTIRNGDVITVPGRLGARAILWNYHEDGPTARAGVLRIRTR